jgi:hypothetical protein
MSLAAEVAVAALQRFLTWQMEAAVGTLHTVDCLGVNCLGAAGIYLSLFSLAEQMAKDEVESPKGQNEQEISKSHGKIL